MKLPKGGSHSASRRPAAVPVAGGLCAAIAIGSASVRAAPTPVAHSATSSTAAALFVSEPALPPAALSLARLGDQAVRRGDFDEAARRYALAALQAPADPILREMEGVALSAARHSDLAVPQFRQAVRLGGDNDVIATLLLQAALAEGGDANEAQGLYQDTRRRYATAGAGMLDASASVRRIEARLRQETDSAILFLLLGDACQLGERWPAADAAYASATKFAPTWSKPLVNRGLALLAQGKTETAIQLFTLATRLDPQNVQAKVWKGDAELRGGQNRHAISTLNGVAVAESVAPGVRSQAAVGLGQAFANEKQYTRAVSTLGVARRLAPLDPRPAAVMGEVQLQAGNYAAATQAFATALRLTDSGGLFGERPVLYRALAEAQLSARRPGDALSTLEEAESQEPASAALWHRLAAQAHFDAGDTATGLAELLGALDLEPGRYPFDTLNAIAGRSLLVDVKHHYEALLGEIHVGSAGASTAKSNGIAITIHPLSPSAPEDRARALSALAHIARYENRTADEIALRMELTRLRGAGADWYLLGEAYDQRAGLPLLARDSYGRAMQLGGLSAAQSAWAKKRLTTLTGASFRP
jgi:tetratricopeptide (TPR) repeat protein